MKITIIKVKIQTIVNNNNNNWMIKSLINELLKNTVK